MGEERRKRENKRMERTGNRELFRRRGRERTGNRENGRREEEEREQENGENREQAALRRRGGR